MEECTNCGKALVDYDFTYLNVGEQEFRINIWHCMNCEQTDVIINDREVLSWILEK